MHSRFYCSWLDHGLKCGLKSTSVYCEVIVFRWDNAICGTNKISSKLWAVASGYTNRGVVSNSAFWILMHKGLYVSIRCQNRLFKMIPLKFRGFLVARDPFTYVKTIPSVQMLYENPTVKTLDTLLICV